MYFVKHSCSVGRKCVSDRFDYSFWFGDLNYRINGTRKMIDNLLATNMTEVCFINGFSGKPMTVGAAS